MQVTVFSLKECSNCLATERLLIQSQIQYDKVLVDDDEAQREALLALNVGTQMPIVVARHSDQEEPVDTWGGFRYDRIKALKKLIFS